MSTSLLVQTAAAGLIAAGIVLAFAARFSDSSLWMAAAAAALGADQAVKWAADVLLRGHGPMPLLGGRLVLDYGLNPMQGFGGDFGAILAITALAAIFAAMLYCGLAERGYRMARASAVGCGLIAGGFVGVALDRAFRSAVVDLVCFGPRGAYVYNVADLAVFAGFVLLAARLLLLAPDVWRRRRAIWADLTGRAGECA